MLGTGFLSRTQPLVAQWQSDKRSRLVLPDEDLALNIQRGETAALNTLVERHYSPLLGYLYRMTGGNRALAEDLTQEAFLRALRGIDRYTHPRPFKAWLYAIATNTARDHFKSADSRHTNSMAEDFDAPADIAPDANLLAADDARAVVRALGALPDHQREAVILRYYQDLSLSEIAEALGIPVGTVKSRLSLGLKKMRELLGESVK